MEVRKGVVWTGHRGGMCRYGDTGGRADEIIQQTSDSWTSQ